MPKDEKIIKPDYSVLQKIGLSRSAINCYAGLLELGPANINQIAAHLSLTKTNLYRILRLLETRGFVTALKTPAQPVYFTARSVEESVEHYFRYQLKIIRPLTAPLIFRPGRPEWD